jgi:imidazolonepropionase-like amidohydrolase
MPPAHDSNEDTIVINGGLLIDGTGRPPIENASVVMRDGKILWVGKTNRLEKYPGAKVIDVTGKTIMPGMVECHFHMHLDVEYATFAQSELDIARPSQWMILCALRACEMALKCGYTSVVGAGTAHNIDFWIKQAIEKGLFLGPRVMPASREISTTGGYVDWAPSWWKLQIDGLPIAADGAQEMAKVARLVMKDGAQIVKIFPSGEGAFIGDYDSYFHDCRREREVMTFDEVKAVTDEVHRWNRLVMAHARNPISVRHCLEAGVDIVNHATFLDEKCWKLFKEKPPMAVCPALGFLSFVIKQDWHNPEFQAKAGYKEEYESGCANMQRLHKMGVKVVPGGDYGQFDIPHGLYAKDLQVFVEDCHFTPLETISMATKNGSYLMRMENEIGTLEEGKKADVLVIDGNPLDDITIMQDRKRILLVLKDGKVVASKGRVLSTDWDLFNKENTETLQKIIGSNGRVPTTISVKRR